MLHVTATLLLPETVALNCCVCAACNVTGPGASDTATGTRLTVAMVDFVVSAALVAVTVIVCAELITAGAVYVPLLVILPTKGLMVQVTFVLIVPVKVAVNC